MRTQRAHFQLRQCVPALNTLRYLAPLPLAIAAMAVASRWGFHIPNLPGVLLLPLAYSAYRGGLVIGLIAAAMHIVNSAVFFSLPGHLFEYESDNLQRTLVIVVVAAVMATMLGTLRRKSDQSLRKLKVAEQDLRRLNFKLEERIEERTAELVKIAQHDGLTGIANRSVLLARMAEVLSRPPGAGFCFFLLDLDLFKTVNDSLGHPVGDELLKLVARRLSACMRETDVVARLGGDEFAILTTADGDQREHATLTANRLLEVVAAPYELDEHHIDIGTSIGIALGPEHGTDPDQLMKCADLALYKAKAEGRNTYRFFEAAMGTEAADRRALQIDLRAALRNDEFELLYQPIVDINTEQIASIEALVCWRHPRRGLVAPADFIPLAEETGLINPIGQWVLRKACHDAVGWPSHVKVSVNLSPIQFRKISPLSIFCEALTDSGLPPERLEVEITESVLLEGSAENIDTLHRLRLMGISIVLDDFGTGFSSLSYLRMFPFDKIKIDRSFVHELANSADCSSIVAAVAALGRSLRISTVAEGVETEEQLVLVRAAGCTHAQGFLFGRPCPAAELKFQRQSNAKGEAA